MNAVKPVHLVTASGDKLPILQHIRALVQLGECNIFHEFVVVKSLVTPVILGVDFLSENGLVLDFSQTPILVQSSSLRSRPSIESNIAIAHVFPIYEASQANLD